jgi:putative ABC transport system permease protein
MYYTFFLEPLRDIYLRSDRDVAEKGSIKNVYLFSVIALFILLIACVNFINLSTARSAGRAREVGIRKVLGANAGQLMTQFLAESVIIAILAFLLSLVLSTLAIPLFNNLAGKTISSGLLEQGRELCVMLPIAVGIGILAGLYPSFVLSAYNPIVVLKGRFSRGTKGIWLRKALVVFQFSISAALIIGTLVVYRQMQFMRGHDLGFNKDQVLVLNTFGEHGKNVLKESIAQLPEVKAVAMSSSVPGGSNPGAYSEIENREGDFQVANMSLYLVDYDYIPSFGMQMLAGRSFSRDYFTDSTQAMVLNETAAKMFGYKSPEEAIGKKFKQWGREGKIIGVVRDFHFRSLQENIKPLTIRIEPDACNLITIRLTGKNIPAAIDKMQHLWLQYVPNRPFSYYFLDDFFDKQYRAEFRFGNLFFHFALLAIFISCLGLLGLASYATMQRTSEIAVRKLLGADIVGIVKLLSVEFLALVLLAFLIAAPASWLAMHRWLEDFAYRTRIDWWIYALAFTLTILISLATISVQTIRAALTNPIKTLHSD